MRPTSLAIASIRALCHGSETEERARETAVVERSGGRLQAVESGVPDREGEDRGGRHRHGSRGSRGPPAPRSCTSPGWFDPTVMHEIGPTLLPEQERVVEPAPEQRRRSAVVLGGAQDNDRVGLLDVAGVVVVRSAPHDDAGRADRDEGEDAARGRGG